MVGKWFARVRRLLASHLRSSLGPVNLLFCKGLFTSAVKARQALQTFVNTVGLCWLSLAFVGLLLASISRGGNKVRYSGTPHLHRKLLCAFVADCLYFLHDCYPWLEISHWYPWLEIIHWYPWPEISHWYPWLEISHWYPWLEIIYWLHSWIYGHYTHICLYAYLKYAKKLLQ